MRTRLLRRCQPEKTHAQRIAVAAEKQTPAPGQAILPVRARSAFDGGEQRSAAHCHLSWSVCLPTLTAASSSVSAAIVCCLGVLILQQSTALTIFFEQAIVSGC